MTACLCPLPLIIPPISLIKADLPSTESDVKLVFFHFTFVQRKALDTE
jgi:hypothetical protein